MACDEKDKEVQELKDRANKVKDTLANSGNRSHVDWKALLTEVEAIVSLISKLFPA